MKTFRKFTNQQLKDLLSHAGYDTKHFFEDAERSELLRHCRKFYTPDQANETLENISSNQGQ